MSCILLKENILSIDKELSELSMSTSFNYMLGEMIC